MKLWLNVAEGAEYAGVCRDLIYGACAARRMHHIRVGGRRAIRLKREWLDAWLERHAVVAQDGPTPPRAEVDPGARTEGRPCVNRRAVPRFLNVDEAAELLRTTRRAIYAMVERRQLPGVVRLRRRVLFRSDVLLDWLDQKCAPSPKE